jgi:hypothetical protein
MEARAGQHMLDTHTTTEFSAQEAQQFDFFIASRSETRVPSFGGVYMVALAILSFHRLRKSIAERGRL